jgi:hypothetical protein
VAALAGLDGAQLGELPLALELVARQRLGGVGVVQGDHDEGGQDEEDDPTGHGRKYLLIDFLPTVGGK